MSQGELLIVDAFRAAFQDRRRRRLRLAIIATSSIVAPAIVLLYLLERHDAVSMLTGLAAWTLTSG